MRPVERTDRLASGLQQNLAALLRAAIALTTPAPFVDQREGSPVASVGRNARKLGSVTSSHAPERRLNVRFMSERHPLHL